MTIKGLTIEERWVYFISAIFIILNALCITLEFYYFALIPLFLLIVILALFSIDKLVLILVFMTPFTIPLQEISSNYDFDMALPTEPILFGVMILFLLKLAVERKFDKRIAFHPVSIAIYINLFWLFVTSITSSMPLVSFKYLISRLWFVIAFYFIAVQLFKNYKNIKRYFWLYLIPLMGVIGYTLYRHFLHGFDQQSGNWVMTPFYKDHTSYGAILAMVIPVLIGLGTKSNYSKNFKILVWIVFPIIIVATIFSYTRAAWFSLLGAFGVWIVLLLRIKFKVFLTITIVVVLILIRYQASLLMMMEKNKQDSSTNLSEHVKSMSNVATDASNLERINRWKSALRMYEKRPFFGWGPGTYMFQYAPFQISSEKTIISTNAGDRGNAHSEFLGPLAESGVFGTLTYLALVIAIIYTGIRAWQRSKDKDTRTMSLVFLLAMITYFLHGFLNNFLDTDKASVLFWGYAAMLVAMDIYHNNGQMIENQSVQQTGAKTDKA